MNRITTLIWCSKYSGDCLLAKSSTIKEEITLRTPLWRKWEISLKRNSMMAILMNKNMCNFTLGFFTGSLSIVSLLKTCQIKAFSLLFWPNLNTEVRYSWKLSTWDQRVFPNIWLHHLSSPEVNQTLNTKFNKIHLKKLDSHQLLSIFKKETEMSFHFSSKLFMKTMTLIKLWNLLMKWPSMLKVISCWTTMFLTLRSKLIFWFSRPNANCSEQLILMKFQRFLLLLSQHLKISKEIFKQRDSTLKLTPNQTHFHVPFKDMMMLKKSYNLKHIRYCWQHNS